MSKNGTKIYELAEPWVPSHGKKKAKHVVTFEVKYGQMFWIPPAWQHQVGTVGGDVVTLNGEKTAATMTWITWALPKHLREHALALFAMGGTDEEQVAVGKLKKDKEAIMAKMEVLCSQRPATLPAGASGYSSDDDDAAAVVARGVALP